MSMLALALLVGAGLFALWCLVSWLVHGGPKIVVGAASRGRRLLLFDGDCGFCRRWLSWSLRRRQQPFEAIACQDASALRAELGISDAQCVESAFLILYAPGVAPRVLAGAAAVNGVLAGFRGARNVGWRLLASLYPLPVARQVENAAYRWVARNRHRFGSGECEILPGPLGPRLGGPR